MFSANPRSVPTARLLRALEYDEAQEIASSGAKVLHPRCIMPVKQYGIPLYVYATQTPKLEGTVITTHGGNVAAQVKAVTIKKNITLVSMETVGMWHSVGFLADAFQVFKDHGLSVDLVSTSETSVTVSLDPAANTLDKPTLDALVVDLGKLCRVEVIGPCAAVSLVGRNIRAILHRLGDALELFEEQKIYLVTQAANDLNITFVIDEAQGDRLVSRLHDIAIQKMTADRVLGPTWEELYGPKDKAASDLKQWWHDRRDDLVALGREHGAAFVYDRATLTKKAKALRALPGIEGVFYALKANWHPEIIKLFAEQGLGFECVSRGEVEHVVKTVPSIEKQKILFTPNFAPREEYEWGLQPGHLGDARQPASAEGLAGAVQEPRRVHSHRHGLRPRPSRQGAHGRRAFEVRRAVVRNGRAGATGEGGGREGHRPARAHRQRCVQRRQLEVGGRHAHRAHAALQGRAHRRCRWRARRAGAAGSAGRGVVRVRRNARRR